MPRISALLSVLVALLVSIAAGGLLSVRAQDATPVGGDATPVAGEATTAAAVLYGVDGTVVGTVLLREQADGSVDVVVDAVGLEPGAHGIHAHETGQCDPTGEKAFTSAGGHFNPTEAEHGEHAGDLGNIAVDDEGVGRFEETTEALTLTAGETGLFDEDGAAIVIHADEDQNDPEGTSFGARVACGVLATQAGDSEGGAVPAE